jgi:hypothetical protein
MKILFIILCIIVAYIYCYFVFPDNITILQTSLNEFDFNLLLQRQPLVVEDSVKDILTLLKSWFSSNIIRDVEFNEKKMWNINYHKYIYLYSLSDNNEVLLYQAGNKVIDDVPDNREPVLSINLKKYQGVIIPFRWYYNISNKNNSKIYGIHDYCTYLVDLIF